MHDKEVFLINVISLALGSPFRLKVMLNEVHNM